MNMNKVFSVTEDMGDLIFFHTYKTIRNKKRKLTKINENKRIRTKLNKNKETRTEMNENE